MTPAEILSSEFADVAQDLRARNEPFAFATIIRTAGTTAAKPGAKALIRADGTIVRGFLGGGCTRGAVKRASMEAIQSGVPQLISIAPEDLLSEMGVTPGATSDGITYARNGVLREGQSTSSLNPSCRCLCWSYSVHLPLRKHLRSLPRIFTGLLALSHRRVLRRPVCALL